MGSISQSLEPSCLELDGPRQPPRGDAYGCTCSLLARVCLLDSRHSDAQAVHPVFLHRYVVQLRELYLEIDPWIRG